MLPWKSRRRAMSASGSVARNLHARLDEKFTLERQSFAERPIENGADAAAERAEAWS